MKNFEKIKKNGNMEKWKLLKKKKNCKKNGKNVEKIGKNEKTLEKIEKL